MKITKVTRERGPVPPDQPVTVVTTSDEPTEPPIMPDALKLAVREALAGTVPQRSDFTTARDFQNAVMAMINRAYTLHNYWRGQLGGLIAPTADPPSAVAIATLESFLKGPLTRAHEEAVRAVQNEEVDAASNAKTKASFEQWEAEKRKFLGWAEGEGIA